MLLRSWQYIHGVDWRRLNVLLLLWFCYSITAYGQIFVSNYGANSILEFDAQTGGFITPFIPAGNGGLSHPDGIAFGPDGNLYVAVSASGPPQVLRYNGQTGAFIDIFASSPSSCSGGFTDMIFGPNGDLFVGHYGCSGADQIAQIEEFNGATGTFVKVFASIVPRPACTCVQDFVFGPDGNLYVATQAEVQEFSGTTGAYIRSLAAVPLDGSSTDGVAFGPDGNIYVSTSTGSFDGSGGQISTYSSATGTLLGTFIPPFSGGLGYGHHIVFRPDGKLYVVDTAYSQILRYDATTGAFIDSFIPSGSGGLQTPVNLTFQPKPTPPYSLCLLYDPTKVVKSGATVPIKLELCGESGKDLSSSTITLHATGITLISSSISGNVEDAGNANPDNDFRFDSTLGTSGGYIFNLKTIGFSTGSYNMNFTAGSDPTVYTAPFQIK